MSLYASASIRPRARWILGIGLALLFGRNVPATETPGITWRSDLAQAQQEARAKDRPLWIQFTGPWCYFCQRMDRESFTHQGVLNHSEQSFIPVKLQSDMHEDLASRLGITGLPATVIVAPSGNVLATHQGFLDGNSFRGFLENTLALHTASRPAPHDSGEERTAAESPRPQSRIGLAGYCPVSLVRGQRLVLGDEHLTAEYAGRLYRFADDFGRAEFLKRPHRYVPVNGGACPVSQVDQGKLRQGHPRFGILFGGHLYLCADEEQRLQFLKTPHRYTRVNLAERDLCPHCWGRDILQNPTGVRLSSLRVNESKPDLTRPEIDEPVQRTAALDR